MKFFDNHCVIAVDEAGRGSLIDGVFVCAGFFDLQSLPQKVADSKKLTFEERIEIYSQIVSCKNHIFSVKVSSIEDIEKTNILHATLQTMRLCCDDVYNKLLTRMEEKNFNIPTNNKRIIKQQTCKLNNDNFAKKTLDKINKKALNTSSGTLKVNCVQNDMFTIDSTNQDDCAVEKNKHKQEKNIIALLDGNQVFNSSSYQVICAVKADNLYTQVAASSIIAKVERDLHILNNLHSSFAFYNWNKNFGYATKDHIEAIKKYGLSPHHRKSFCKNFSPMQNTQDELF